MNSSITKTIINYIKLFLSLDGITAFVIPNKSKPISLLLISRVFVSKITIERTEEQVLYLGKYLFFSQL